ncbi:MAG: hypothetical protein F6K35_15420, partial [Okeania sp. SIO2H7]|nr:hypothetical protein [Okeania sp. SIO2H7]
SGYFGDQKIKKFFEAEISYDFLLFDRLLRKYSCQRRGCLYLGGHQGEMLLTLVLLGFKKILVAEPQPESTDFSSSVIVQDIDHCGIAFLI